ncbi:hypothetical protein BZL30_5750 [Mycobacterium kansasii]|uniref:Uncharacterized protein n=1 Tax=Mycobacterium kansasii TaxID=1768 RepID=A0A1V3WNR1_MYCKA|nr:hypothetical protein BZL29_6740 [Mycobacterium kansasii]OOK71802.1 hypothetical protein BZL30_5750 [Mycobacterium kansasii]
MPPDGFAVARCVDEAVHSRYGAEVLDVTVVVRSGGGVG